MDHVPRWKRLCIAALSELDPAKVAERITVARSAVLDQIEDNISQSSNHEQLTLHNAVEALDVLRKIVQRKVAQRETLQREIGEDRKTGTCSDVPQHKLRSRGFRL
jgi:hypothetical protein